MRLWGGVLATFALFALSGCGGNTKTYEIPSEAMEPTLSVGDEIDVDLNAYSDSTPEVGDIVVFHPPAGADNGTECGEPHPFEQACEVPTEDLSSQDFLKRVAALPGDELSIEDGFVVLNGERQDEPFVAPCGNGGACNLPKTITIPSDHYFMLGDNRGASDDSRYWGPVPLEAIEGRADVNE
jgi:signal peptidase I